MQLYLHTALLQMLLFQKIKAILISHFMTPLKVIKILANKDWFENEVSPLGSIWEANPIVSVNNRSVCVQKQDYTLRREETAVFVCSVNVARHTHTHTQAQCRFISSCCSKHFNPSNVMFSAKQKHHVRHFSRLDDRRERERERDTYRQHSVASLIFIRLHSDVAHK